MGIARDNFIVKTYLWRDIARLDFVKKKHKFREDERVLFACCRISDYKTRTKFISKTQKTLLLHVRKWNLFMKFTDDDIEPYSFPSKLIFYLASRMALIVY